MRSGERRKGREGRKGTERSGKERKGKERERKKKREVGGGVIGFCVGIDGDGSTFGMDRVREGLFL